MRVTGTLINYFFHCKRQCYLAYNHINLEDESEDVKIGKALHELKFKNEVKFKNIALDKIDSEFVTEFKKSDSDETAATWQLLYYLKTLKDAGILRLGKLKFGENRNLPKKEMIIELTNEKEKELEIVLKNLEILLSSQTPPKALMSKKCKKCAYFSYCFI